jgi:DNA-binding SARP family transcriptional activator
VAELGDGDLGRSARARLVGLRLVAEEDRFDLGLALGRHLELVADLEASLADDRLSERRWRQLMVALYRSGRQADALRAYQRARRALVDALGVEPGVELKELEAAIIRHDPDLDLAPRAASGWRRW